MSNLDSEDNEVFLKALDDLSKVPTTVVNKSSGEVESFDSDGNQVSNVSEETKDSDDKITIDTATDSNNDIAKEHSKDDESNDEEDKVTIVDDSSVEKQDVEDEIPTDNNINNIVESDEFLKYKNFYEHATGKLDVNGVSINGIDDPDKILEIQQQWIENSAKLDELSKVRPILDSIKNNGLIDDPEKFGFAMELLNGNPEALKVLLKDKDIDVFDLDLEDANIDKVETNKHYISKAEIEFNDFISEAKSAKVDDKLANSVFKDWDDNSISELVNDKTSRKIIVNHMQSGWFDKIQEEIARQEVYDTTGIFRKKDDIDKYEIASNILSKNIEKKKTIKISEPEVKKEVVEVKKVTKVAKKKDITESRIKKAAEASKASISSSPSVNSDRNTGSLMDLDDDDFLASIQAML